jgi:hypothetical protein
VTAAATPRAASGTAAATRRTTVRRVTSRNGSHRVGEAYGVIGTRARTARSGG